MKRVQNYREIYEAFEGIDRAGLARALKSSTNWLNQVISGFKQVSPHMAIRIEKACGIKRDILRPDIFRIL